MIDQVITISKQASKEIMEIYNGNEFDIEIKKDNSPVTKADLISNNIIVEGLKNISDYPVVTEESPVTYEERRNWNKFWLVDPLDGTKDFIARNGEFTINIALIKNDKSVLGVVYVPVSGDVYYAERQKGAYKNGVKIFNESNRAELVAADSNFHSTSEVKMFFSRYDITKIKKFGSSIKICKLSEGIIDVYPRLNGTKEWDTAASHIIANEAGCKLVDVSTGRELVYNKEDIRNNFFIASRKNLEFSP